MAQDMIAVANELAVVGELACADAHALAAQMGVTPLELGKAVNRETGLRFNRCQLGLFGYGPKAEGKSKIILPATNVPDDVAEAIRAKTVNGRIACGDVWDLADRFKYPRLGIANIIEALGLRVAPCQLGCF
jgi:hypothetical protein